MKPAQTDLGETEFPHMKPVGNSLVPVPSAPLVARDPVDLLEVVARAAMSPDVDPSKMREILAMRKELQAEKAKAEFDAAFAAFQAECPVIQKLKGVQVNGRTMYSYAPLEDCVTVIKPLCEKHGFSFTFDTDVASQEGWVIAYCDVKHKSGHKERSTAKFPLGTKTNLMSDTQQYSAALTFASRRVLGQAFGLVFAGEDLDGRTQRPPAKGPSKMAANPDVKPLAQELWNLLKSVRGTESNWVLANRFLIDECVITPDEAVPDISADRFRQVIELAKQKLQK